jgi:hypothetical protein
VTKNSRGVRRIASSTRSSSTSHARICCVYHLDARELGLHEQLLDWDATYSARNTRRKGFVSAWNQSSHRLFLWLMSHGQLRRSDKLPGSMDAPHKMMD